MLTNSKINVSGNSNQVFQAIALIQAWIQTDLVKKDLVKHWARIPKQENSIPFLDRPLFSKATLFKKAKFRSKFTKKKCSPSSKRFMKERRQKILKKAKLLELSWRNCWNIKKFNLQSFLKSDYSKAVNWSLLTARKKEISTMKR